MRKKIITSEWHARNLKNSGDLEMTSIYDGCCADFSFGVGLLTIFFVPLFSKFSGIMKTVVIC